MLGNTAHHIQQILHLLYNGQFVDPVRRPQSDKAPSTRVVLNTDSHMVFNALTRG